MDPASSPAPDGLPPSPLAGLVALVDAPGDLLLGWTLVLAQVGPGVAVRLVVLALLLALSALVAAASAALAAIPPDERERLSRRVRGLLDQPRRTLVALLVLRTLADVGAAVLAAHLALAAAAATGWGPAVALIGAVVALALVLLTLCTVGPRRAALRRPLAVAKVATALLAPLLWLVGPPAGLLARAMERVHAWRHPPAESREDAYERTLAEVEETHGALAEEEAALIHSLLEFGDTTVREVMVGRMDIVALPASATLDEALALIREAGHSRYPLYGASLDDVLGVVYAKDLLPFAGADRRPDRTLDLRSLARKARFVPPGRKLDDLLADFQQHNTHIALVVDEYGGTLGLVTLEDLLEEVVGEIRDELDTPEDEPRLEPVGPDTFRVDARIGLDDLFDALGVEVETDGLGFETLGGLVYHLAGAVPSPGQEVAFGGLRLRVEAVEANRIRDVLVTRLPEPEQSTAERKVSGQ